MVTIINAENVKRYFKIFIILAAVLNISTSCGNNQQTNQTNIMNTAERTNSGKVLIFYFSHAGENYGVGNIEVGNTKIVAGYIKEITGGDEFEIVAEKSYDMPYSQLIKIAKQETNSGELPAFKGEVTDIGQYDTIFIGGPIWWGTYPQVMFTFFQKYDLNGKTIFPFVTHEGSGLANTVEDLKEQYPQADIKEGFAIYGHEVRQGKEKVVKWLKSLGY